jgi:hypothetical protein
VLDAFFLKHPVPVVPETFQIEVEYFWKVRHTPNLVQGVENIDSFCEVIARKIFYSVDSYAEALQEWARMGRPSDMEDCLQGAKKSKLRQHEQTQRKRVENRELTLAEFRKQQAPVHMIEVLEGMLFREYLVHSLIRESIKVL